MSPFPCPGFWLAVPPRLKDRTFYVGKVVNDLGIIYKLENGQVERYSYGQWGEGPGELISSDVHANGFWIKADPKPEKK
jgi:hypothetical protein